MADKKISQLTKKDVVTGDERIPFASGGTNGYITPEGIKTFSEEKYTNTDPTTSTEFSIPVGSTFADFTFSDLMNSLYPELFGTLTAPSSTFTSSITGIREVGVALNLSFNSTFNRGSINPQYESDSGFRSGLPTGYVYTGTGLSNVSKTDMTDSQTVNSYIVLAGSNTWTGRVAYSVGVQPKGSKGTAFDNELPAGQTGAISRTITGIYPYFWGKVDSPTKPEKNQTLIDNGSKVVADSSGTITISFNTTPTEWAWFAIPANYNIKTSWYIGPLNNGGIGGAGDLFDSAESKNIDSPNLYRNGVAYNIYMSNYASEISSPMEIRN